ncbi:MAG: hypothetical protein H0T75_15070 [Rhizobiales bacterium]|nr:hypothetical protein [Hyphomicrobiales bacterium]
MTLVSTQQAFTPALSVDSGSPLVLIEHIADILGEAHGFGGFLFDRRGRLIVKDGVTWLYTTRTSGGRWESWVRPFNPNTLQPGPARRVLLPSAGHDRAVLHHVVAIADDFIVGFFCDGVGVGAAIASAPDADFVHDPTFVLQPEIGWETRGGSVEGWSLESNGAYVLCEDTADETVFWQGYDSYRKDGRLGDLGWAKVRVDKKTRRVKLLGRHPDNPLAFRNPEWLCARCGGNLSSDVMIAGKRTFFFYLRPNTSEMFIGLALSDDPLFFQNVSHYIVDTILDEETVAEKFQAVQTDDELLIFYESRSTDGSWRTGLRCYRIRVPRASP